jgi:hypothetical protein
MTSVLPEPGDQTRGERGPVWLAPPQLPPWPVVWLALEGGPAAGPADHAIHLWGLAVDDGSGEPVPEAIVADRDDPDGRRAWERFVARAGEIIERHPEARWVHGSPGEGASVRACAARHGAPPGLLLRLEEALFDLLSRGVRRAVRLPAGACSIRQLAALAGFRWRRPPAGPAGSAGRHRKALAGSDPVGRSRILAESADANAEKLLAMRAVWRWMLEQGPREHCG